MADKPLFYLPQRLRADQSLSLPDDTARHVGQVLRMGTGEVLQLTDGAGQLADCIIAEAGKKKIGVRVQAVTSQPKPVPALELAIAFTKNASRNEWLLEKATELGVQRILPLITSRSNRERIWHDHWHTILISAMLQSRQCWLPVLEQPMVMATLLKDPIDQQLIAHCVEDLSRQPITEALKKGADIRIFIGPEGDFNPAEVSSAVSVGAIAVTLGRNRLRTETAALAAITHFYLTNHAV